MALSVDVVVVGAGLVGAVAALGPAGKGYSVVVVERRKPEIQRGNCADETSTHNHYISR